MRNGGIQLRASDLIFAIKKRWKLIALLTAAGLIVGIIMSGVSYLQGAMSRNFEIRGSVVTSSVQDDGTYVYGHDHPGIDDIRFASEITDEAVYILKSERVMNDALESLEVIGVTTNDIYNCLTVTQYDETQVIQLKLTWRSAEEGIEVLKAVISSADKVLRSTMKAGGLEMINQPYTRYLVGGGLNVPMWGYMLILGCAAGIGIAVIEMLMKPTLVNLRDVENVFGLETFGVIPRNDSYFKRKKSLLITDSVVPSDVEQNYSAAAYILRNRLDTKVKNHCFYVTSATAGEGKTAVAANLAIQLSDMEKKVLLIDFNTKNPGLGGLFLDRVDYTNSMNALYKGDASEDEAITMLSGYLDILPMILENDPIPMDNTVVDLVTRMRERYDYVIIDAPAVGEVSDTLSLNQIANTVLFVIRYDTPAVQAIKDALNKLNKSGTHVLGCIVNAAVSLKDSIPNSSESRVKKHLHTSKKSGSSDRGLSGSGKPER